MAITPPIEAQIEAQKGNCGICGEPLDEDFHLDHILPVSKCGDSVAENMQVTHARCNLLKNASLTYFDANGQGVMALGYSR